MSDISGCIEHLREPKKGCEYCALVYRTHYAPKEAAALERAVIDAAMQCTEVVTGTMRDRVGHAAVVLDKLAERCAALRAFRAGTK